MPEMQPPPEMNDYAPTPDSTQPSQSDTLEIETSALLRPGGEQLVAQSSGGASELPWYRQKVLVPRPVVAATLVSLLALLLIVATPLGATIYRLATLLRPTATTAPALSPSSPSPLPTSTPFQYPTPTLVVPAIGQLPADCVPNAPMVNFAPDTTLPGVGGAGVWLIAGPFLGANLTNPPREAVARLSGLDPKLYTQYGWPVQILLFIRDDLTQTITLGGLDIHTRNSLWFASDPNVNPSSTVPIAPIVTIDPIHPLSSAGHWRVWFGTLYLPGAGCYSLTAQWAGGGWMVVFPAGR